MSLSPMSVRAPVARRALVLCAALLAAHLVPAQAAPALQPVALPDARLAAAGITLVRPVAATAATRSFPATVVSNPADALLLTAPVAGLVTAVRVQPNQRVKAGQPIAVLQAPELADAAAAWLETRAEARVADDTLSREQALHAEGIVPAARVRRAEAAALQARARLAARRARLRLLGLGDAELEAIDHGAALPTRVTLGSPGAGIVGELPVGVGARVESNALVARVSRTDRLALELRVPAAQAGRLVEGSAVLSAEGERIATLGPVAGEVGDGQALRVRALLSAPGAWLLGQAVEVRLATQATGWRLPRAAVVQAAPGHWVFRRQGERFVPTPVTLVDDDGAHVVVRGALTPQSQVAQGNVVLLKGAALGLGGEAR